MNSDRKGLDRSGRCFWVAAFRAGFVSTGGLKAFDINDFMATLQNEYLQRSKFMNMKSANSSLHPAFASCIISGPKKKKGTFISKSSEILIVIPVRIS